MFTAKYFESSIWRMKMAMSDTAAVASDMNTRMCISLGMTSIILLRVMAGIVLHVTSLMNINVYEVIAISSSPKQSSNDFVTYITTC